MAIVARQPNHITFSWKNLTKGALILLRKMTEKTLSLSIAQAYFLEGASLRSFRLDHLDDERSLKHSFFLVSLFVQRKNTEYLVQILRCHFLDDLIGPTEKNKREFDSYRPVP